MRTTGRWAIVWLVTTAGCVGEKDAATLDPTGDDPVDTETDTVPPPDTVTSDSGTPTEPTDSATTVDCLGTSRLASPVAATLPTSTSTGTWSGSTSTGTTWTSTSTSTSTSTGTSTTWTTTTTDPGETGIDTGGGPAGVRLWFDAVWGIDENGCLTSTFLDGQEIVPQLNVRIGDADWLVGDLDAIDQYCTVQLLLAGGTPNPAWVSALPALYWGVGHDGVTAVTDCVDLDSDLFTYDPVGFLLGLGGWGVAAGDLNPLVREGLLDADIDLTNIFGGAMRNPWIDASNPTPTTYAFAYQTDLDENVILTGGEASPIPAADIDLGGGQVAQGHYTLYSYYYYLL